MEGMTGTEGGSRCMEERLALEGAEDEEASARDGDEWFCWL